MTQSIPPKHLVLYADDDKDDIALVEEAFSATTDNIELVTAFDGDAALSYLNSLSQFDPDPCLIILDVNMPRLNGKETLQKIRQMERFNKIPVVLFTTSSLSVDKNFAEKYNAGFVSKPLSTDQMRRITAQFIDHCTDEVKNTLRRRH
jgi:CheY-like chemotaxis protein